MDTNRIKNVALGARAQLMVATGSALDRVLAADSRERVARPTDVSRIESAIASRGSDGRDKVIEQVAYTWFNRLCALRYMDVRGYTPVGIVSPRAGETLPAILADARRGIYAPGLEISAETQREVSGIIDGTMPAPDPLGHAYVKLLLAACSMYARSMDYLFGAGLDLGPSIELLAPTDLLSEGSLLQRICTGLDEATCSEGVEVMGWLYQFYVSERKDAFFASKKKATAADIAPATQLFTPNWIVRYLVENSLGRLWMLNFPDSELRDHMDYYVEPEEPETDFLKIYSPEDITFLDPACGSGHILVYAFDLLYLMYEEEGYRPADIPELILKNNLTGIEIDNRAAEIASFCLEMKALEKDPGSLSKDVDAHIVVAQKFEPSKEARELIPELCARASLMNELAHLDEIGSLFKPKEELSYLLESLIAGLSGDYSIEAANLYESLEDLAKVIRTLTAPYSVVVSNPPYMGYGNMNAWLSKWIKDNYVDEKGDLCTCFIARCIDFTLSTGYAALITMQSWMFLTSYEKMRKRVISTKSLVTMAHLGAHAFDAIGGEVVATTCSVFMNCHDDVYCTFIRLVDYDDAATKRGALIQALQGNNEGIVYSRHLNSFASLPGMPLSYWGNESFIKLYSGKTVGDIAQAKSGMTTTDNKRFLRLWQEVSYDKIGFGYADIRLTTDKKYRWFPFAKGGEFRRWYGNYEYIVDWYDNGRDIRKAAEGASGGRLVNVDIALRNCLVWTKISSSEISLRLKDSGIFFSDAAPGLFTSSADVYYILALMNSSCVNYGLALINPTLNYVPGAIASIPVVQSSEKDEISDISRENCNISRVDWNAFETSWDFKQHPLIKGNHIETAFEDWQNYCRKRFNQLKANEEEINRIFASIYGMEGEVPIEVPDDKVSVRLADLGRDIRSLVSYGVGCMFGRYSLDEPGLILADEGSTLDDYHAKVPNPTYEPDRTGIIPITEFDHPFFGDDIVAQFRRWLAAAYGEDTLGENIAFIENALGKSLRAYFARDFYNDHVKTYQKRPIYWLFSSPNRGLQALVYLHRYTPQTVSTLLADYVRPLRDNLGAQARLLEVSGKAKDASLAAKYDATVAELDAWEHDVIFPLAQRHVELDLDDGVKVNYGKPEFKGALRKVVGLN